MMRFICTTTLQRLDRVWYDFDGGYDDTNNPFASIPEEYTKKKEEQLAKHTVKRMSAHQRQINKVRGGRWGVERRGCKDPGEGQKGGKERIEEGGGREGGDVVSGCCTSAGQ